MGPLRSFGPLLFFFLLVPFSSAGCRTTSLHYTASKYTDPVLSYMANHGVDSDNCVFTVEYRLIGENVDCDSRVNVNISAADGAISCEKNQIDDGKDYKSGKVQRVRCNCQWDVCIDNIMSYLGIQGQNPECFTKLKQVFEEKRSLSDRLNNPQQSYGPMPFTTTAKAPESEGLSGGAIAGIVCGILIFLLLCGGAGLLLVFRCCSKTDKKEIGTDEFVPVPVGPVGPVGPIGYNAPMGAPTAPMPIAQVEAPPLGASPYPHFNPNGPPPIRPPPPMAQVGAPPPGTSPYPQFNPSMEPPPPQTFQQMPQQPINAQQEWNMGNQQTPTGPSPQNFQQSPEEPVVVEQGGSTMQNGNKMMNSRQGLNKQGSNMDNRKKDSRNGSGFQEQ